MALTGRYQHLATGLGVISMPTNPLKIAVIGAGISGLACATHLKNIGFDVTAMEKVEVLPAGFQHALRKTGSVIMARSTLLPAILIFTKKCNAG